MNIANFIEELSAHKILLWADGDRLRYHAPQGALTPDLLAKISRHKAEILTFLQEHADDLSEAYPLSHGQRALWFLYQLAPKSPAYNIMFAGSLRPDLDISSLKTAFETLVLRHASLRTTFTTQDGQSIQQVHKHPTIHFKVTDAAHWSRDELNNWLDEEADRPFDLEKGPLLRLELLTQFSETEASSPDPILLLTAHHIVLDFWSIEIFMRELHGLYQAFKSGTQVSLPPLKGHYKDYVQWENDMLAGHAGDRLWAYWQKQLDGDLPLLNLPTDYPRPAVQTYHGASYPFELDDQLSHQIRELTKATGSTLYVTLLAAFQVLLLRYTGQKDILIGSPMLGRSRTEFEEIVGYFVNPVILRADMPGNPSFNELSQRVGHTVRGALDHQDYPFGQLIEKLQTVRDPSRSPLFQVAFVLDKLYHQQPAVNGQLREQETFITEILASEQRGAAFDLVLFVFDSESGLSGFWQYNTDLFNNTTISRMTGHFQTLLAGIVANPEQRIEELPLLTVAEQQQLLAWNDTVTDYPNERCIHQLFEEQAEQRPDAIAVVFENQHLSYTALNKNANQLAHYLQTLGVKPEVLVGICVERSLEMVIGLLGILKAGGAYLPLEPDYPKARLAFMLEDAQPPVLLTEQKLVTDLPATKAQMICLDNDWKIISRFGDDNPATEIKPENLAYVIYTSGSTGQPKGAMNTHHGICNRLLWMQDAYQLVVTDNVLQKTPFGFDVSVWEFFWPLRTGACLIVAKPKEHKDPDYLVKLIAQQNITTLHFVPSMLQAFIQAPGLDTFPSLKRVICSGEALPFELQQQFFTSLPAVELHNLYGPTEAAIDVTYWACQKDSILNPIPIGRPIANTQIHILDQHLRPVPPGIPGELHIGGVGLARGYFNRPKLTAEKFIPNPFSEEPNALLYKTGDLARYLPDGNIEYLGRLDHQVKLRGFRIELAEIEMVLAQHPAVRESVVLVQRTEADYDRLVGYIVPDRKLAFPVIQWLNFENQGLLDDKARYELPNGMLITHLNKNETEFVYQEIFEQKTYLRHGITIHPEDCIFDVGANIGLFTLFAAQMKSVQIYAFEPIPPVFELLRLNTALYGPNVKLFDVGLSNEQKSVTFTYYPHASVISGRFANAAEEQKVVKSFLLKQQATNKVLVSTEEIDVLLAERLESKQFTCPLRTISDVMREYGVERIDLLKIDVEKSEWDVLSGIQKEDWSKIKQIVVEVHDVEGRLEQMTTLLEEHGYSLGIEQDSLLADTGIYNIYAIQSSWKQSLSEENDEKLAYNAEPAWLNQNSLVSDVRSFLQDKLPEYMVPAVFVTMEALPLTPNGKIDRQKLEQLAINSDSLVENHFVAPSTTEEELLAGIWSQVLSIEPIGTQDNFFALGGHSLLATQVISRIRDTFNLELSLRRLFKYPLLKDLAKQIKNQTSQTKIPPIIPVERGKPLPLSFTQERLWFLDQLEGQNAIYNIPAALRLTGELNIAALKQSFNEIIRRHEVLRTTFSTVDEQPVQIIAPSLTLQVPIVDLQLLPEIEQSTEVQRLVTAEAQHPFNLIKGPLMRVLLLRLQPDEQVICVTQHHTVSDGWSTWIFIQEITAIYEAFSKGQPSPLPEMSIQYADFTLWQRQWLSGDVLDKQLNYWQQQLADVPSVLELPADHSRPSALTFRGHLTYFTINEDITKQLKALSRQTETTLFMVLLAAYAVLLGRYSGQEDIVIGSPIANRNRKEIESLIGFFVNTLTLRIDLSGQSNFLELLKRVRKIALDAYTHQDTPFEQVVEAVHPERNMSYTPLFQVMFGLQNVPSDTLRLPELTVTPLAIETGTARCDLTLLMEETKLGLTGVFEYSTDLFEESTIARMIGHFQILLTDIVAQPQQLVTQLRLLTDAEQHKLLIDWNNTYTTYPQDACIHRLFEAQVEQTPEAVAVVFAEQQLTYHELNVRANQLAHYLQTLGVGTDVLVGLCVERSVEMVIGVLGILKAGGAYLSLDSSYPKDNLAFMLEDSQISVLLAHEKLVTRLPSHNARVVFLDRTATEGNFITPNSKDNPISDVTADNLAYVSYTSGSTGRPKGVCINQRSVIRLVKNTNYANFTADQIFLQFAPLAFDASTLEIWGPLLNGAKLVVMPPQTPSLEELGSVIRQHQVTTLWLTSGLFNQMVDERLEDLNSVRQLLAGGDVLSVPHVRTVLRGLKECQLINGYGPTENTTFTCCFPITENQIGTSVPIGRPIANTQVYILDVYLQPVPVGVPGELLIGGDGLALGYLNRPELTAEKFIPNPVSDAPNSRLYKTGDLVRYRLDGNIEFLGRFDNQVKIRGFRIELGEIETVLAQHPAVQETVVIVKEYQTNDKRLVAYMVPEPNVAVPSTSSELLRFLKEKLPDYMVPSALVILDALPLNPNGKVDRNALPAPENLVDEESYVAPRTPTEEILAGLFADILKLEQVGIHHDFFDLGGHSLLATQLISRIRNTFSVELPLRRLFESPTIGELAANIETARRDELSQSPPIQPMAREQALPLSFAQERLWFLDQLEPGNPFYNVPAALRLTGVLNTTALEQSLKEIVQRHEVLRATLTQVAGQPVQMIAPTFPTDPILKIIDISEEEITAWVMDEFRRPFDLAKDALFRSTLLRLSETEHVWILTMHHTVSDGWSLGVLIQELVALYSAFAKSEPSPLADLPIQYADFALWQRQWLTGDILENQLSYWKQQLAGAPPVLKLPTNRLHPAEQSFRGSSETFYIDSQVTKQLKALTQGAGTTLFMTLLAAFATLLFRYSSQEDMVIGSPIANRNRAEIEPLIGFFVNTLALRLDLSGNPTFTTLLEQVRQVALDAYSHQDLPFEKLVDELQVERDLSYNPLFQVMFALQNAPMEQLELPGLSMAPVEMKRVAALFDIVLDLWEIDDQLVGVWEYNTDIFDASTIVRMVGHFQTLLASIAAHPELAVSELPLLTEAEKHDLLFSYGNGVSKDYPIHKSLPQLIAEQAAATPNRVAAVHANQSISYVRLNERANQIAHWLRRIGIQPNDFVGILEERGLDFLAAMLGILKAGGAFLPIDPSYPDDRVRYMVMDSQIHTLITRSVLFDKMATEVEKSGYLRHLLCFDDSKPKFLGKAWFLKDIEKEVTTNPSDLNEPTDMAYMLYTSGSTGLPKGTMVRHNGAVNHIYAEFDELAFHQNTAFLQSAPSSSDISVWQFLAPLLIGGRTVIVDFETVCDPVKLFKVIKSQQVTLIELVPVVMQGVLEHVAQLSPEERALPDLEWAMVTGEAVSVSLVNQWLHTYPHIKLVNAYGPTEAADDICQAVLDKPLPTNQITVPIGKPIANLTLYVLDRHFKLQPINVPGEICVSGIGVGAGYWRNEEKTRASFVNNPYSEDTYNDSIYRTGDLGRWLPDGSLEFIGRLDHQVKIRGFRIELGEIEGVLSQHPAVRETIVLDREDEDQPGDKRLVAYLVANMQGEGLQDQINELDAEQVSLWQDLHEDSYSDAPSHQDPTFNIIGWDSTYTGQQLPDEEMHERVDTTIDRILSLQPQNVLEIGCGTGLLMYRIAPNCENYVGTDLSSVALKRLEDSKYYVNINGMEHVTLRQQMADDFDGFEANAFDTVVMNSVLQYFPSVDYLLRVLKGTFNVVKAGGTIFIGDVRSLPLIKAYHASVQFYKAEDSVTLLELDQRIRKQMVQEQELAIAPTFFMALKAHFPQQISLVEIQPERGFFHNEMTRFRYDVILHLKERENEPEKWMSEMVWLDWQQQALSLSDIRARLVENQPPYLALRHVANARLETETQVLDWLANAASTETVGQLRESLSTFESKPVDPEALWQLTQELPYDIDISCSVDRTDGSYDVIFRHRSEKGNDPLSLTHYPLPITPDWNEYTNNPLQEKFTRKLLPQLRSFLKEKLPAHMLPTDFVVLETFPLMPNGKVDREALPAPDTSRNILTEGYVAPCNPIEEGLATIWTEILGLEQVGIHDNFFELGGHSLKATQVISRIHKELGVEMAVRDMFNLPTIAELAQEIGTKSTTTYFDIERVPDAEHYPVSHAQRRLWVLAQMEGGSAAYHMASAILLEGNLESAAFERAFSALVERHESLRTTFISVDGEPQQQVHSQIDTQMDFLDLTAEAEPLQLAQELAIEDARTEFDLEKGPLIRMSLLKLADNQFALLFNMHHIISDGWSLEVLAREFLQLYTDFRQSKTPSLPPLRIQYRDYAFWQNNLLQRDTVSVHRDYWHDKLAGEIPVLNLPTDFPRPPVKTYNGKQYYRLTTVPMPALQNFSRQQNVSLFMTLVALVKVLFYRYTEQEDIIIGSPVAGRDHADLENQIGFYVNTLVLRDKSQGDMSFADFLQQIKNTTLEAHEHQIYPFDRLVQDFNLRRDVSRTPLFDVMVVMQNVESVEFSLEGIQVSPLLTEYGTSQFDLTLSFEERRDGLHTTIWYNTDLFLEERIVRLTQHFETLVTSILADASQPIAHLNILPKSEQQQLLQEFNGKAVDYPHDNSLVDLFVAQVERTPDAVAVTFETQKLTYRELNTKANQIAHHLIELGIGANVLVGLCVERSLEMVVGILGILKAGGAYVPLDPAYPAERLAFMLEDSQVSVLLTQQQLGMGNWESVIEKKIQVVYLESDWTKIGDNFTNAQLPMPKPENWAYVIYTSGSTGKPKGVLVTHANVARLFSATQPWYHFNEKDVWTLFHSYAFDFSVWELWGALLYGGRLVVVPYLTSRSPEAFYDLLDSEGVTVLNQTPSAFRQLIQVEESAEAAKSLNLRTVIFGGEALDIASLRPWFERHGDQTPQLVNMYGITETTVHVTYRPLTLADLNSQGSVIGRAIPDLQVYILDQHGQPVPIGVPGELHIGGAGLANGYLNRPDLTAEKFIHYSLTIDHERLQCQLYKTGDLARYLSNGDIEYLGRIDNQVKIRGFRIELGEIESVLTSHSAVRETIVRAQKQTDDIRLVAYLTIADQNTPNTNELRRFLQEKLPDYMVPAAFIMLEAFPLTPSGKIDIRALPAPDQTRPNMETTYIAPQSELERTLAAVWQEALGVEKVGVQDNVFDLGAHSVLIIQVRQKLAEILKKDIPVVQLFKYPTISALAEYFSQTPNTQETATALVQLMQDRANKRKMAQQRRKPTKRTE